LFVLVYLASLTAPQCSVLTNDRSIPLIESLLILRTKLFGLSPMIPSFITILPMRFTVSSTETPPGGVPSGCGPIPEDPDAHNNLGFAPTTKGQYQNAIAELREATRLKPNLAAGAHHAWKRAVSRQKVWRKSVAVTSLIQGMILVRSTYQEHAKLN
jgi:hypothetical protein